MSIWLWLNGELLKSTEAFISPFDRGFLHGDGVFETLRAECGKALFLAQHLERLQRSLQHLSIPVSLDLDWPALVHRLLAANRLLDSSAAIKLLVTRGPCPGPGLPVPVHPTFCVTTQPYTPPTPADYGRGWDLVACRHGFSPPLAAHKTLNYLYFHVARQAAIEAGADEALILDPEEHVTETSAGTLLARTEGRWWTPSSPFQLPSITLRMAKEILDSRGEPVSFHPAAVDHLQAAETVWVLNSLMLVMPARTIAGRGTPQPSPREAEELRQDLILLGLDSASS